MKGREMHGEVKEKLQSIPYHHSIPHCLKHGGRSIIVWVGVAANETGSLGSRLLEGREMEYSSMAKSVIYPQPNRDFFSVTWDKTEGRKSHKRAATEGDYREVVAEHLKKRNKNLVISMGSRTSVVIDCQGFSSKCDNPSCSSCLSHSLFLGGVREWS